MCGHATVAGVHALGQSGRLPLPDDAESVGIEIETRSGVLQAFVERVPNASDERMIWLELINPKLTPCEIDFTELASRLGMSSDAFDRDLPLVVTQDHDVLVFVKGFQQLNEAQPNFASLGEYMSAMGWRGMSLATVGTLTPSLSVQSRFFAPAVGIDEDPVTGSVHGPLAAYLVQQARVPVHDGTAGLMCSQGIPGGRVGLLYALVQPIRGAFSVRIGGKALTVERGALDE